MSVTGGTSATEVNLNSTVPSAPAGNQNAVPQAGSPYPDPNNIALTIRDVTYYIPAATFALLGVVKPDNTTITIAGDGTITALSGAGTVTDVTGTAPIQSTGGTTPDISVDLATVGTVGVVQPDGSTITIDPDGTIHSIAGTGPTFVDEEVVSGSGTSWTLANVPSPASSLMLFQKVDSFGDVKLRRTVDFTDSGASITTVNSFSAGDLQAWYRM